SSLAHLARLAELGVVQRFPGADGERHAVEDDGALGANAVQHRPRAAAHAEEVLGDDLEPVGGAALLEELGEVRGAKPDAVAEEGNHGQLERWITGPGQASPLGGRRTARGYFLATTTLPPLSVHSFLVWAGPQPCPLQPFWPPQLLLAPAQEPVPLQELMPAHFPSPPALSWPWSAAWAAVANIAHTAVAMKAPFRFFAFMSRRPLLVELHGPAGRPQEADGHSEEYGASPGDVTASPGRADVAASRLEESGSARPTVGGHAGAQRKASSGMASGDQARPLPMGRLQAGQPGPGSELHPVAKANPAQRAEHCHVGEGETPVEGGPSRDEARQPVEAIAGPLFLSAEVRRLGGPNAV